MPSTHAQPLQPASAAHGGIAPFSAWYALLILIIGIVLGAVDKVVLTLMAEPLRQSLSLSDTQIGLLQGGGVLLFTGLVTYPLGWLSDRYDRRIVLAGCIVLWSAVTGLRGTAESYGVLLITAIGLGIGDAGIAPITNGQIPRLFSRAQRVTANSFFVVTTIFGAALGALLGSAVVGLTDDLRPYLPASMQHMEVWRLTFFFMAALEIPVAGLMLTIKPMANQSGAVEDAPFELVPEGTNMVEFGAYLRANRRTLLGLVAGVGLASIGHAAVATWVPILAARNFGASPAEVGQGIGLASLAGTAIGAALGYLIMRLARKKLGLAAPLRVVMTGYVVAALISTLLLFATSSTQTFVLMGALVVPLMSGALAMPNALQDASPPHLRSRAIALYTMSILPFRVLGPLAIGVLSDRLRNYPGGLTLAIVSTTLVGGVAGAWLLRRIEEPFTQLMRTSQARS